MNVTKGSKHIPPAPLPVVHLNGTSREDLIHGYHYAYRALESFREALASSTCNPRDYYILDDNEPYPRAKEIRNQVFALVDEIEQYISDHIYHLTD
jgi:hypothetical protein